MDNKIDLYKVVEVMRLKNETANFSFKDKDIYSQSLLLWAMGKGNVLNNNKIIMSYNEILQASGLAESVRLFELETFIREFVQKAGTDIIEYKGLNSHKVPVEVTIPLFKRIENYPETEEVIFTINESMKELYEFESGYYTLPSRTYYEKGTPYSKRLLLQLSKHRYLGQVNFATEELRYLLGVPESYNTGKIKTRILDKAVEELKADFPGLTFSEIRKRKTIVQYSFTWDKKSQYDKKDAEILDRDPELLKDVKKAEKPAESKQLMEGSNPLDSRITKYIAENYGKLGVSENFDWKNSSLATAEEIRIKFQANELLSFLSKRSTAAPVRRNPLARENFSDEDWQMMMDHLM